MKQEEFINKICLSLREYGWDFSDEMEKEVKKALADAWAYGYNEGRTEIAKVALTKNKKRELNYITSTYQRHYSDFCIW